ncbi:unnamed protein product [Rotaria magnacalcarata]|uniref:PiggyBac transposable element-derived protein domain-containing protein n=1 Tax=Rotaria magnacalcarata TaxID=392030 RepID=A0A816Y3Y9_9BILA|nr:unnamed protein product [Rotaria magnacalcarata]CAF2154167.1 unnamed protein product [Rotaria magnacalcarata]
MDKENVFDDESDSEDEGKVILNLPDSDVDEIEDQLNGIGLNDDDDVYLPHEMNKLMSSNVQQNNNDDWLLVEPDSDQRPEDLPEFKEKIGPTFAVGSSPSPATFYNEMLPDSLFDHIVVCTNSRARAHFNNILSSSQSQETWKLVSRDEMKKFFAIVVQMGMVRKRSIKEYWSADPYLVTPIFHSPQYLSRNRFLFILW